MEQAGLVSPSANTKSITVMGKVFDSSKPKEYLDSFAIKKV
jgi:nitrate/nitrite transport system substrate-binding protein